MPNIAICLAGPDISGGGVVILEHARSLNKLGHAVCLVMKQKFGEERFNWHPSHSMIERGEIAILTYAEASQQEFDIAIATYWDTVFDLYRIPATSYAYFIQSIESRFAAESEIGLRYLIDGTYELGLSMITITHWMQDYIKQLTGEDSYLVPNGINKDMFNETGKKIKPRINSKFRVLVEGPIDVGFKNVPRTVDACLQANVQELWLLTSSNVNTYNGVDRVFSRVPLWKAAEVYRSCDVIVKLSLVEGMFGPPLETFHCGGTSIAFDVTGHDEYMVHGENSLIVPTGNYEAVINYIKLLQSSPEALAHLKEGAKKTAASWNDWEQSGRIFEQAILGTIKQGTVARPQLKMRTQRIWGLYRQGLNMAERMPRGYSQPESVADTDIPGSVADTDIIVLRQTIRALMQSKSLRFTKPLRYLRSAVSRKNGTPFEQQGNDNSLDDLQDILSSNRDSHAERQYLQEVVRDIKRSNSWRLTWPCRLVGSFVRLALSLIR